MSDTPDFKALTDFLLKYGGKKYYSETNTQHADDPLSNEIRINAPDYEHNKQKLISFCENLPFLPNDENNRYIVRDGLRHWQNSGKITSYMWIEILNECKTNVTSISVFISTHKVMQKKKALFRVCLETRFDENRQFRKYYDYFEKKEKPADLDLLLAGKNKEPYKSTLKWEHLKELVKDSNYIQRDNYIELGRLYPLTEHTTNATLEQRLVDTVKTLLPYYECII